MHNKELQRNARDYLVHTRLGIQKEQFNRSFVLEKGNAFNVEPENEKKKVTSRNTSTAVLQSQYTPPHLTVWLLGRCELQSTT